MAPRSASRATSIAGAPFLAEHGLQSLIEAVAIEGTKVRIVGGAVRNHLLGVPVSDIDLATDARPEVVTARSEAAGFKVHPTGIDHGTLTVVAKGRPFEITTLRSDISTDGRRATVAYSTDWIVDATRRDFTMNAIYADADGTLFDPVGGVEDAYHRRVRFIGSPADRIAEDYLRILRFFRFHAAYGEGAIDAEGLSASIRARHGFDVLSRERIGQEMHKLVVARRAAETLALMQLCGLLGPVIAGIGRPAVLGRLLEGLREAGQRPDPMLALGALAVFSETDADRVTDRLRLSRQECAFLAALPPLARSLGPRPMPHALRVAVYRHGNRLAEAALRLASAMEAVAVEADRLAIAATWAAPKFPLSGGDLLAAGCKPGPLLGKSLKSLEEKWISSDFRDVPPVEFLPFSEEVKARS
ncbi:CCA-adding enzyme [Hartmannibacter diazotrophicus]|uniref:CCA-adding enzyme n=1 Tax=Hartmannibacter diazotrophicus TaxID=1482074 RepID=A0A2C9D8I7_9HYPH|nr:CCA tRNA nucleotidyltransferase [Hartmannibacter diazotrophicus]SON56553.1 CCA-adding enzyme [Hartmannibacter diazotrophicus]